MSLWCHKLRHLELLLNRAVDPHNVFKTHLKTASDADGENTFQSEETGLL